MSSTALITGATQGIGYELAKIFAKDEYNLVLVARNENRLAEIKKELTNRYGISVLVIAKDLSLKSSVKEIHDLINKEKIDINILVNNAGFGFSGKFSDLSLENELSEIELNVVTLTALTHLILSEMLKRGEGKILNLASIAAFAPGPGMAVYYATKAYVLSFSEALNEELKGTGVSVTALCPGPVNTGFSKRANIKNKRLFNENLLPADKVALIGYKGLLKGKRVVIPGFINILNVFLLKFLPHFLTLKLIKNLHG